MARKLIVCCDGTWNKPESQTRGETSQPTNVLKFARALQAFDQQAATSQIIFYDTGVGTANRIDRLLGGIFGIGLSANILDAYRFLAMNFHPGDEIFLFGFSRGAYTVRSLSGLISLIGLLPKNDIDRLPEAFHYYRTAPAKRSKKKFDMLQQFLADNSEAFRKPRIRMLGVWDSVGALGAPTPLLHRISRHFVGFHDTALASNVDFAYQALALDEKRGPFKPDLWTQGGSAQEIKQVWFPGVHADIGGGYAPPADATSRHSNQPPPLLSDTALSWMISIAHRHGLQFDANYLAQHVHVASDATLHDSYSPAYRLLDKLGARKFVRRVNEPVYGIGGNEMPVNEYLHPSVLDRWESTQLRYDPQNLTARIVASVPVWQEQQSADILDTNERRRSRRIQLGDVDALFAVAGQEHRCVLLDISKHEGIRIRSEIDVPVGVQIDFNSSLTGPLQGRVVWRDGRQAGVKLAA